MNNTSTSLGRPRSISLVKCLFLVFGLLCTHLSFGQVFFTESFEAAVGTGGSGGDCGCVATPVDFSDGGNDYFARVTDADITANTVSDYTGELDLAGMVGEGTAHYWASEDNDDSAVGGTGMSTLCITMTTSIAGRTNLFFSALFGANAISFGYEPEDNMEVFYQIDGGGFVSLLDFREDASETISLDTDGDDIGDGVVVLSSVFQSISAPIPATGTSIDIRICTTSASSNEEFAVDHVQLEEFVAPVVCPTVDAASLSESTVCANAPFNATATGLANMAQSDNNEQDFGIEFVAFTSTPADPYMGGTSLGVVPFGSLTAGGTTAALVGATLATAGTYTVYAILEPTPTDMTCRPSAVTASIQVDPAPAPTASSPGNFCTNDGPQTGLGDGMPTGGVYAGPGVTDNGNGMTFDFDPTAAGVGVQMITYTVTDMNGCAGTANFNIEVLAAPVVAFTALADLCVNDGVQGPIGGGGTPTGGVYSGPGVTDGGDGMTYTFDPAAAGVAVHTLTYTFTATNGCMESASDDVQVFSTPTVTFTAPADLCIDAGVQVNLGGGMPTGGVYSGPGVSDDGNGMTYSFDPAAAGPGVQSITYMVGVAGCSDSAMDDVEVFSLPVVVIELGGLFCVNDTARTIDPFESPSGGVYSGAGVTDNGNGDTFTFDPTAAGVGSILITYTVTDMNGCTDSATGSIFVNDLPTVGFTAPADLCINDGVQTGLGGGTPPQGTITGDMGVYSGPGVTDGGNGMTYDFDPAAAGVGVHTLTYTYTDENSCSASASDDVEVFAIPNALFTALADLCIDAGVQMNLGGGTPTGGVYSGAGVTDDGNGMTYSFDPTAAGVGVHTITYMVGISGCSDVAMDDVEVFALPTVNLSTVDAYCLDAPIQGAPLTGGTPSGGVYSGNGVSDLGNGMSYNFDPLAVGVGVHTIIYTVTDMNGCTSSNSSTIEVVDCGVSITDPCSCLNNATVLDLDAGTGGDDGQFSETVSIVDNNGGMLAMGQTWSVVGAMGAFDADNVPAMGMQSAGVPIPADGSITLTFNAGAYELPFVHVDALGYSLTIEGPFPVGSPANVTLVISNNCSYPNPVFDPILTGLDLCVQDPAFTLGGSDPA
ncbi:MAG: hypothetical protein AAGD05_06400, partial [Bacteroidota bacterium]